MTAFKLHHTKFYTRHTGQTNGSPHCYRCDEILANDNRVTLVCTDNGFALPGGQEADGADMEDFGDESPMYVTMGAFCALKAIAGF